MTTALRNHIATAKPGLRWRKGFAALGDGHAPWLGEVERLRKVSARSCDEPSDPSADNLAGAGFPPYWARSVTVSCSS